MEDLTKMLSLEAYQLILEAEKTKVEFWILSQEVNELMGMQLQGYNKQRSYEIRQRIHQSKLLVEELKWLNIELRRCVQQRRLK